MASFKYKAINKEGKLVSGTAEGDNPFTLGRTLKSEGLELISAEPVSAKKKGLNFEINFFSRITVHEKIIFAHNLATMLNAGLALSRALSVISKQSPNKMLKTTLDAINETIRKGTSLTDAFKQFPKIFPPLFVSMVSAGEESGKLSESLEVVASQMEKSYMLQKKIKGAMIYPSVIISAMVLVAILMLVYIVPTLTGTFRELKIDLPASTQAIIFVSDALKNHLLLIVLGLAGVVGGLVAAAKTAAGKKFFNTIVLRLPIVGPLYKETQAARTTRTLASLLSAGVPVLQALQIVEEVIQNVHYKAVLKRAAQQIQVGAPISGVFMESSHLYPVFVGEMMAVGEETGELGHMLQSVAEFYEQEVEQKTKDMSTVIEPVLMIVVGAAVGFFALSMITPMYTLMDNL